MANVPEIRESTQVSSNFMEDTQINSGSPSPAKLDLNPNDKFFAILESNLENYINDRPAAYNFITSQLKNYRGKYLF
jgi:hypothetical protein